MALTQKGNRVYAKVTDLSEETALNAGDKIIFHSTSTGNTCIIDWASIKIDLEHCTFGTTFSQIVEFTSTAQAWVDTVTESFNEVEENCNSVMENVKQVNYQLEAIKLLLKLMLGAVNDKDVQRQTDYENSLSTEARKTYDEIINEVTAAQSDDMSGIDFTLNNFISYGSY